MDPGLEPLGGGAGILSRLSEIMGKGVPGLPLLIHIPTL